MVLVDTSVWISHFREGNALLINLLNECSVICHPFIVGELACGHLKNRSEILLLLQTLPMSVQAEYEEVLIFIDKNQLMGNGLGYIDIHLLASAVLTRIPIWTFDKKLCAIATKLSLSFNKEE